MRLLITTLKWKQFQAAGNAKDVGVYGEDGLMASKEQDTARCLGTDAFEGS